MADPSQFEADELLRLLTDALRAGPASPEWHEAVTRLRTAGSAESDEYHLLMTARQRLESGREYRSVSAGPTFTRKVMESIEREAGRPLGMPSANIIAVFAIVGVLAVVVVVAVLLSRSPAPKPTAQDLIATYFGTTAVSTDFSEGIPAQWRKFGVEPVAVPFERYLRGGFSKESEKDYHGGGIVAVTPFAADQPFAVEATIRMAKPTGLVDLRVFVTEDPTFDQNREATSPREFAVDLINGQFSVFTPDGTSAPQTMKLDAERGSAYLLIKMDREFAVVEVDGKQLYAGAHGLSPAKSRWPAIRFLAKGSEQSLDDVTVQSVRILKP
ncbi:MAG TPA: hypothetical protein VHP11_09750 [Tepidisphaeraceae bacterium]|nr:hypothetical protein [Tepidisphaeraceae bacterium]